MLKLVVHIVTTKLWELKFKAYGVSTRSHVTVERVRLRAQEGCKESGKIVHVSEDCSRLWCDVAQHDRNVPNSRTDVSKFPPDYTASHTSPDTLLLLLLLLFEVTSVTTSISSFPCWVKIYGEGGGMAPRILTLSIRKEMVSFMSQLSHTRGEKRQVPKKNNEDGQAPGPV